MFRLRHLTQHASLADAALAVVALIGSVLLVGWLTELVRFATAQLPAFRAAGLLRLGRIFTQEQTGRRADRRPAQHRPA